MCVLSTGRKRMNAFEAIRTMRNDQRILLGITADDLAFINLFCRFTDVVLKDV